MTNKLSNTLKKKLKASLESLTARQSGRLFLIYSNECHEKDTHAIWEYPPIVELMAVWKTRVEEAKIKGGNIEEQTVAAFNAFIDLTDLIKEANRLADSDLWRLYARVLGYGNIIEYSLHQEINSELTRITVDLFTEDAARPLSWDDYLKAVEWYEGYSPTDLEELANELTGAYTRRQGYKILEVPEEYLKSISTPDIEYGGEDERIRRMWVESEGEDLILSKYFAGDQERFEAWKKYGGYPEFNGQEWNKMSDGILDSLINKIKAGELEGGVCFFLQSNWESVPALNWDRNDPDNTSQLIIPAWNVLRPLWELWLYDKGIFGPSDKRIEADYPDIVCAFYDLDGILEEDRITARAKEFYLDCMKKPWGSGLIEAKNVDFVELGRFLCTHDSPLQGYYAPDLGTVNVKAFHEAEGNDLFLGLSETAGDAWYYATLRGLREIAEELGTKPEKVGKNYIKEFYYPTEDPSDKREAISTLIYRLNKSRSDRRIFRFTKRGRPDISHLLGMELFKTLDTAIKEFGKVYDDLETLKLTHDLISQEFFEGIPVLFPELRERLEGIETAFKSTEERLKDFSEGLGGSIRNIYYSPLHLIKNGPDEETARMMVGALIAAVDKDQDKKRFPSRLDGGETMADIAKKISGTDYAGIKKAIRKWGMS